MLTKKANYSLEFSDIQPLYLPEMKESVFVDQGIRVDINDLKKTLTKIASNKSAVLETDGDAQSDFDLEAEIKKHPDSLYVKCFAIKADETNDNGDFFGYDELKLATNSFVGVPVFTNHQNSDINEARGKVVYSWWEEDRNGIMIIARVDSAAYPQLARGIKEEYVAGTSMGCQVKYSVCSICHNYAETPDQYCSHIRERKTRTISVAKQKCDYHENGGDDKCPICESAAKDKHTYKVSEQEVFEYNYGIKFIENSFVVNPACHDCGVTEIIDPQSFLAKVAHIKNTLPRLIKVARETPLICTDKGCANVMNEEQEGILKDSLTVLAEGAEYIIRLSGVDFLKESIKKLTKEAGQKELDDLNTALGLITSVSQSMLSQKDQIDLEFLSDLVQVLSDLQDTIDELTEQGYGRLQSGEAGDAAQDPQAGQAQGAPTEMSYPGSNAPPGTSKIQAGPAGDVGTVTGPLAKRILDLEKLSKNLMKTRNRLTLSLDKTNNKKLDLDLRLGV